MLAWAPFEASVLKDILKELKPLGQSDPELEEWISWITADGRIVDLNKVTLDHFFHPDMGGRTSIKVVLDALWKSDDAMRARFASVMGREGDRMKGPYAALPSLEIIWKGAAGQRRNGRDSGVRGDDVWRRAGGSGDEGAVGAVAQAVLRAGYAGDGAHLGVLGAADPGYELELSIVAVPAFIATHGVPEVLGRG